MPATNWVCVWVFVCLPCTIALGAALQHFNFLFIFAFIRFFHVLCAAWPNFFVGSYVRSLARFFHAPIFFFLFYSLFFITICLHFLAFIFVFVYISSVAGAAVTAALHAPCVHWTLLSHLLNALKSSWKLIAACIERWGGVLKYAQLRSRTHAYMCVCLFVCVCVCDTFELVFIACSPAYTPNCLCIYYNIPPYVCMYVCVCISFVCLQRSPTPFVDHCH